MDTTCPNRLKCKFQESRVGFLGYVSIRVFDSDSIWCSCDIVKWEGDTNHASINTSALFGICMCCSSSIYSLTVTTASMVIPRAAIDWLPFAMVAGLNARAFTAERQIRTFGVHLECFLGGFRIYWWGLRRNILVETWWILSIEEFTLLLK